MRPVYLFIISVLIFSLHIDFWPAKAVVEYVEGLDYGVNEIDSTAVNKFITKEYYLYELYFENYSDKTFSIPGYSVDLGVHYSNISEVNALFKHKSGKKLAFLDFAAGATAIALGGIARTASLTAVRSIGTFTKRRGIGSNSSFLSYDKTYIIYPGDGISLFIFVKKDLAQIPNTVRFVCREEDNNKTYVVINDRFDIRKGNAKFDNEQKRNVIADPKTGIYK